MKKIIRPLLAFIIFHSACFLSAHAQGTAFTYQGRLDDGGNPATGLYDLRFTICDAASDGNVVGAGGITNSATPVTNGLFTVTLDFGGGVFDGNARWLEIGVQAVGGTNFITLAPRQALAATPYAQYAGSAATTMVAASANAVAGVNIQGQVPVSKLPSSVLTNGAAFVGDGAGVTNVNAAMLNGLDATNFWQLGGNAATPGQFLGTTNTLPLELWSGNQRVLRLEQTFASAPNVIAGAAVNFVGASGMTIVGATIAGGGALNYYGLKHTNSVTADFGTVSGGSRNTVSGIMSSVGGGFNNTASGQLAVVSGGQNNFVDGMYASVAGGYGGRAGNSYATVGGGQNNLAAGMHSTVVGGYGGWAGNSYATVAGGYDNYALGQSSLAAGHMAMAQHDGSFVWADASSSMAFSSVRMNEFAVRAAGGMRLLTSGAGVNVDGQVTATYFWGNGGGLTNVHASSLENFSPASFWQLGGNNVSGGQFIGSTNNQPFELWAGGNRGLWLQYTTVPSGFTSKSGVNVVGGYAGNYISGSVVGGTIAGGGDYYWSGISGTSYTNSVTGHFGTVGGGYGNTAGFLATVPGGHDNSAIGSGSFAAGVNAAAGDANSFVWSDGNPAASSSAARSFDVFAAGGTYIHGDADVSGNVWIGTNCSVATLTIRGGADLAEPFNLSAGEGQVSAGAVVVIDEQNPGHLKLSNQPYDTHVAGVVSGANGVHPGIQMHQQGLIEGGQNVALTGRVYVQADASNGAIRPGDLLTSAAIPGYAMKATDHAKSVGAILGKAMTGLSEGKGLVLVLVTLQ